MSFAVVRVRGTLNIKPEIKETLKLLRLTRTNHCIVIPDNPVYRGMLQKVKDYVTWGEINQEVMEKLVSGRARIEGGQSLTEKYVKKNSDFGTFKDLSQAIAGDKFTYKNIPGVNPVFRLSPPGKGGYEGIKRSYRTGGALGYRGEKINDLLEKMI
mgnify:CR=1 FL=1